MQLSPGQLQAQAHAEAYARRQGEEEAARLAALTAEPAVSAPKRSKAAAAPVVVEPASEAPPVVTEEPAAEGATDAA